MSLSGSLANALSGLNAMAFAAKTASSNIANAMTEGYAPRRVQLAAQGGVGLGGVLLVGVTTQADPVLASQLRAASATAAQTDTLNAFHAEVENVIGVPGESGSLSSVYDQFQSALTIAAGQPDSDAALQNLSYAAQDMTGALRNASGKTQDLRRNAETDINRGITDIRDALEQVQSLNRMISERGGNSEETVTLAELRDSQIARINKQIPVRIMARDNGSVALYASNGIALLDPSPANIEFSPSNAMTPLLDAENNTLSAVTINGHSITAQTDFGGGALVAQLQIRDTLAPQVQTSLDEFAATLVSSSQSTDVDPSLATEQAGFFSDAGDHFDTNNTKGLAGRIVLNSAISENIPQNSWRWRDGISATQSGDAANDKILSAFQKRLGQSPANKLDHMLDQIGSAKVNSDTRAASANAILTDLTESRAAQGVDTDAELQSLLIIERNYAANARMIQTISDMFDQLVRI